MKTLIFLFLFFGLYHFIYESVIAPSLRLTLRYNYFALRDKLRNLEINGEVDGKDLELIELLDKSICNIINNISYISFGSYYTIYHRLVRDSNKFKTFSERKKMMIEGAQNAELKGVAKEMSNLSLKALFINNGAWFIYLIIPAIIVVVIAYISMQMGKLIDHFRIISDRLFYSSNLRNGNNFPARTA